MGATGRFYFLISAAIVLIVVAIQVRSSLASADAPHSDPQIAWGVDFLSEPEASQLVAQSGGSYSFVLGYKQGEVAYLGLTQPQLTGGQHLQAAKTIAAVMHPTVVAVTRDSSDSSSVLRDGSSFRTVNIEMNAADEREVLAGRFGPDDANLYLAVREYWNAVENQGLAREDADSFLRSVQSRLALSWPGEAITVFDSYWNSQYSRLGDWRDGSSRLLDPEHGYGVLKAIASYDAHAYLMHTVRVIASLMSKGERVVVLTDPVTAARLEPVLRASLGLPVVAPTFVRNHEEVRREKTVQIQPVIKQAPPSGVTAPSQRDPVSGIK